MMCYHQIRTVITTLQRARTGWLPATCTLVNATAQGLGLYAAIIADACAPLSFAQMARGIIAIGDMMAASISKTSVALGGALNNYASIAMNRSPPLSEPLTLSKSYVSR
jgi:hypothetical protein